MEAMAATAAAPPPAPARSAAPAVATTELVDPHPGAFDGEVRPDFAWIRRLRQLMEATPLAATLLEAVQPLGGHGVDVEELTTVIDGQRRLWKRERKLKNLGLAADFEDFALAIYVYTLERPSVYSVINMAMFDPSRSSGVLRAGVSYELFACAPYIKFLDEALARLPETFVYQGRVQRGVKWVYPTPENHNPENYFKKGTTLTWYEFKSTSTRRDVMSRDNFCGHNPGPRTIFTVTAIRGYSIAAFSFFGDDEAEVLFRPLTMLRVEDAVQNIIDPLERTTLERSGFPDSVILKQVVEEYESEEEEARPVNSQMREVVQDDSCFKLVPKISTNLTWIAQGADILVSESTFLGPAAHFRFHPAHDGSEYLMIESVGTGLYVKADGTSTYSTLVLSSAGPGRSVLPDESCHFRMNPHQDPWFTLRARLAPRMYVDVDIGSGGWLLNTKKINANEGRLQLFTDFFGAWDQHLFRILPVNGS